ncbi:DNA internalization-related competence protein ComEC/Rec2 [Polycyclovorans algicola]|uniref:DNA internalization-related competence protein ComEC/Rec2 n=1 Tax=Polycyclovorans algicola TaxID=616992 RepID=UPI000693F21F|nr:DNA internalization-related competence protein ComEC/Rec2 [Polycyclovorans algicola]
MRWAAAFTLGCGAVLLNPAPWALWWSLPLLLAALWAPLRGIALALLLGAVLCEWQVAERLEDRWPAARHGEVREVTGWISELPDARPADQGAHWRFRLTTDDGAQAAGVPRDVRVSWYDGPETLAAASCWRFTLRLRMPRGSHNPGGFDYEGWLFRERLGATASVRDAVPCDDALGGWRAGLLRLRADWAEGLDRHLGAHPGKAYLAALGVGDGRSLTPAHWQVFRETGTSHLVVISGLHLALMTGVGFALIRVLWPLWPAAALRVPTPVAAGWGAAMLATGYALMAGFEPPVIRALLMVWLALWLALRGGWRQPFRALALIWVVVVAWDPVRLMRPGVWLSFMAVAAIVYLLAFRLRAGPGWRQFAWLQLALGLVMLPMTLGLFAGTSLIAPLANLVAVPLFMLLTPAALLAGVLAQLEVGWVTPPLQWLAAAFAAIDVGLQWLTTLGNGVWWPHAPPWAVSVLALLGVLLLLAPRGVPGRALGLICMAPLLIPRAPDDAPLTVTVLDVGQGLAVVARTPHHTLLYDAGPAWPGGFDAGDAVVVPYLRYRGLSQLDRIMVSHADLDHAGGVAAVREAFPGARLLGADTEAPCAAGQGWQWDGVQFDVLHPAVASASAASAHRNDESCVLRIVVGSQTLLLAGDIEATAEQALVRDAHEKLTAQWLLAPHHGSRTSSSEAFIDAVRPQTVVFSAGWRHHFGHPHPQVVERYAWRGIDRWATAEHGALTWRFDGSAVEPQPQAWRHVHRRRWHAPAAP